MHVLAAAGLTVVLGFVSGDVLYRVVMWDVGPAVAAQTSGLAPLHFTLVFVMIVVWGTVLGNV